MLLIKVTDDVDVFHKPFIHVGVRPDYAAGHSNLLRTMNFVYDKPNKQFVRTFVSKKEVKNIIKLITSHYKFYTLEHFKIVNRKRSKAVDKMIVKL